MNMIGSQNIINAVIIIIVLISIYVVILGSFSPV